MVRMVRVTFAEDALQRPAHGSGLEYPADAGNSGYDVVADRVDPCLCVLLERASVRPVCIVHIERRHPWRVRWDENDPSLDKLLHAGIVEQNRRCRPARVLPHYSTSSTSCVSNYGAMEVCA